MKNIPTTCILINILLFVILSNNAISKQLFHIKSLKQLNMENIELQTLDYSCGAAALSLLFKNYFNDPYEEQTILSDIISRLSEEEMDNRISKGFSMLDLKKSAQRLGYNAEGLILPKEAIVALKGPVIILLKRKKSNHFVVLKGASQGRAFIADPMRGHLRLPLHDLFSQWDGETLVLGRNDFGLPDEHKLSIPVGRKVAPENITVRILQHTPPP